MNLVYDTVNKFYWRRGLIYLFEVGGLLKIFNNWHMVYGTISGIG